MSGIHNLYLTGCDISDDGALAVARALSGVARLDLWGNRISLEGARALANAGLPEMYKAFSESAAKERAGQTELIADDM